MLLSQTIKTHKQIKLTNRATYSKVPNSLATSLQAGELINTISLIICSVVDGVSWSVDAVVLIQGSVSASQTPTSQAPLGSGQVSAAR